MKLNFLKYVILTALIIASFNCHVNEPPVEKKQESTKWELVSELAYLSVRYILKYDNTLYLSAVRPNKSNAGIIYKTSDGSQWTLVREFNRSVGPLTMHGDTLYCLGDSLYRYIIPKNKWESVCEPWPLSSDPQSVSEMIFLKDRLYAMQTLFTNAVDTYEILFDGTIKDLYTYNYLGYGGAKFIRMPGVEDWCYVRGQYYCGGFFTFDGKGFSRLDAGLTHEEWIHPPTNSTAIKGDTLFAGFSRPGSIKYLNNNIWTSYTDSLPRSQYAPNFKPEFTAIAFIKNRLFAGTDQFGVLEWKKGQGWITLSEGLIMLKEGTDLYDPVVFLESINNTLIAAYGEPGYAPWGGCGVYRLTIN